MKAPSRREGLHIRQIDGQTVILDPFKERMHTLNVTAAFVFEAIDGRRSLTEISKELAEQFDVSLETAEADARRTIEQFLELELVS